MKTLSFLACLIGLVAAQTSSYMTYPLGFDQGTPASTTGPCGTSTFDTSTQYQLNDIVPISWESGGGGNNNNNQQTVYLNILNNDYYHSFNNSIANTTFNEMPYYWRIPLTFYTGNFTLQWIWEGWYSCALLEITANDNNVSEVFAGSTINPCLSSELQYYQLQLDQGTSNFMYVDAIPPNPLDEIIVVISSNNATYNVYPTLTIYNEKADTSNPVAGGAVVVGACPWSLNQQDVYEIGISGSSGSDCADSATVTFYSYDGIINSGDSLSIEPHNGDRYYGTYAYQTYEKYQMVVLTADQDIGTSVTLLVDTQCSFTTTNLITGTYPNSKTVCAQLDATNTNLKYIKVTAVNSTYTIQTEAGKCDSIGSTGVSLLFSHAVVLLALVSLLFV